MTIASTVARKDYAGDGAVSVFPTTFKFQANADVKVILRVDATEVETVQVETTNYTLTGAGDASGGDVTMLVFPAIGETLVIKRDVALLQGTDYVRNDEFPAESHEQALDLLTMITQQTNERGDRSLHFKETSGLLDIEMADPVANLGLKWNAAADGVENTLFDPDVSQAAAATSAAAALVSENAASADLALTNADVVTTNADVVTSATNAATAGQFAQVADGAGTVDVITADFTPNITITDKVTVYVIATGANTIAGVTFNPDGLGAKTVRKSGNQALVVGDIVATGHVLHLQRDTTNDVWELLNPATPTTVTASSIVNTPAGNIVATDVQAAIDELDASMPNGNILINALGTVNQRAYVSGTATTGSNEYTLDRWRVPTSGQNLTFTESVNRVIYTPPASGLEEVIEGKDIQSKTYTISWVQETGTTTCTVGGTARTNGESFTLVGGTDTTVQFKSGTFSFPKLELGSTATSFEHRDYASELARCKRYFERMNFNDSSFQHIAAGSVNSTSTVDISLPFSEKRTTPATATSTAVSTFNAVSAGASKTFTGLVLSNMSKKAMLVSLNGGSGLTSGYSCYLRRTSTNTCYIDIDSEL